MAVVVLAGFMAFLSGGGYAATECRAQASQGADGLLVVAAEVSGPVVPVTEKYIERTVSLAEERGADACVLLLNTPGGLYTTTQNIVTRILNSRVPVVVFVHPQGGWAGSAGTFITISAHIAAMAPGTRIGAAHPVSVGDQEPSGAMSEKITEDAAAWARSVAEMRGRNIKAAELAVRESRSYSDTEALEQNLIDLRAPNLQSLLAEIDGRTVTLASGKEVVLSTKGASILNVEMNLFEKALRAVSDPNIAYLLLTLGMAGVLVEIYNPGLIFPGVVGAIGLLLGLYSLGTLDAALSGVLLILLAFGFFIAEVFVPSHGILGTGGVIAFVAGSLMLFSNNPAGLRVSLSLIASTAAFIAVLLALLVAAVIKGQKTPLATGMEALIGRTALADSDLDPKGTVLVEGEIWNAVSEEGPIRAGEEVVITGIERLTLKVKRKS